MGKEYIGELQVASKGLLYNGTFQGGFLHVEPWGTQEERIFISPNIDYDETINRVIKKLTDCPIPPEDLVLADRQHIFIYMRCLSLGGDYSFYFRCDECNEKVKHSMNLETDLNVKYADDPELLKSLGLDSAEDFQEPFEFTLPVQQKKISWHLLRGKDEMRVRKYAQRMARKHGSDERYDYIYRAALRIDAVDGEKVDITDAIALVSSLKGKDSLAIRQAVDRVDFGIDTELEVRCRNCGYPNDLVMPIDKSFFRPERSVI